MGDFDQQKYKQGRMEKSQSDWANAFEGLRQQYGNVSGSGLLQKDMLSNALAHNVDQAALESNIGLNAIAQFTFTLQNPLPQGLGTGGLYTNNFDCPLEIDKGHIQYNRAKHWDISNLGIML
jgi:hypothetical protein